MRSQVTEHLHQKKYKKQINIIENKIKSTKWRKSNKDYNSKNEGTCSLVIIRLNIGLLRLHWLPASSNRMISKSVFSIYKQTTTLLFLVPSKLSIYTNKILLLWNLSEMVDTIQQRIPEETNWGTLQYTAQDLLQLVMEVHHQL